VVKVDEIAICDKKITYDLWLKNAPMEATHMLVLKMPSGHPVPWYILEGQDLKSEARHFGKQRIIAILSIKTGSR
jgi:hypothetical protein